MAYISKENLVSKIQDKITKNPDVSVTDILNLIQAEPDAEIKQLKLATDILDSALSELYESAEDWYREELLENIGTDEEELRALGINW